MTARTLATGRWLAEGIGTQSTAGVIATCRRLLVVLACVAVPLARSAAAEQIPSHWIPVEQAMLNAEVKLANRGKTMVKGIIKCHRKVVSEAAKGKACNEAQLDFCLTQVKTKWLNQTQGLVHNDADDQNAVILQNALVLAGGAAGAFDHIEFGLRRATGRIYCCGTAPLGCNFSGRAPDPSSDPNCTFKNLDKLSKAVGAYAQDLLKCQIDLMKKTFKGEAFSLEGCEAAAGTKFDGKVAKVSALPLCVQTASALFGKGARSVQDDAKAELPDTQRKYASEGAPPSGTPSADQPLDARGCCQGYTSCTDVASKASCTCPPQANCPASDPTCCFYHAVQCNAGGRCESSKCTKTGDPTIDSCDKPEDNCLTCPEDCKQECGDGCNNDGRCGAGETCVSCPGDCTCGSPGCCNCYCSPSFICADGFDSSVTCATYCSNAGCDYAGWVSSTASNPTCASGCYDDD